MLRYVLVFAVLAVFAGVLGFGGVAAGFALLARIAFYLFLVAAVLALVNHAFSGRVV